MRILLIHDFTEPIGGAEIFTHDLKDTLEQGDHIVKLIAGSWHEDRYSRYLSRYFSLKWRSQIGETVQTFDPDFIFCHKVSKNLSPSFLTHPAVSDIPVLLKWGGANEYRYVPRSDAGLEQMIHNFRRFIHRPIVKRYVDTFIAETEFVARLMSGIFPGQDIAQIPNPVTWECRPPKRATDDSRTVLFVGRIEDDKGVYSLLKAFETIASNLPNVKLEYVGDGREKQELAQLSSELGISKQVLFHGYVPHQKLRDIYWESDVLVLPSTIPETFGLAIIEAMSQGTPVITTRLGGQQELVEDGENGYVIEPNNINQLSESLTRLLTDHRLRYQMGQSAVSRARTYTKKNHREKIIDVAKEYL